MNKNQKILLIFIGFCMVIIIGLISFNVLMPKPELKPDDIQVSQRTVEEEPVIEEKRNNTKEYINIFFIGKNSKNEEVYKAVKRVYNKEIDGSKIRFAINELVRGPKMEEQRKGVYTELPAGVEILNITEQADRVIVNFTAAFNMGGTEGIYKRLYQLIKTCKLNTEKPVYLYIEGKKADVIGGDGIMITQPLSEKSFEN